MRDYSEEHSVLVALAERMAERPVLVTFNGKSFDWPLLETRYRMTRSIRAPVPRAHLDFLHPARNLWRLRIGSVRLAELELHVLGWNRGADMVSAMIPQLYFEYLRGGPPEPLVPIFHHNQMDLRGLAALATRTLSLLGNPEKHGHDGFELFGVSRICERRGEAVRARKLYAESITRDLPRRQTARRGVRSRVSRSVKAIWNSRASSGKACWEIRARASKPTSSWRSTTNTAPANRIARRRSPARRCSSFGMPTDWTIPSNAYRDRRLRFEQRLARLERKSGRSLLEALESESRTAVGESNQDQAKGGKFNARIG